VVLRRGSTVGQRANLLIVGADGYELFYTHWRANTLDADLFFGPDPALAFIRSQRSTAEGAEWLDETWAEGGAVLDPTRRELLWFGGEDVHYDVQLRRVHQGIMAELWPGWTVRWAHEGIADLARAVGEPVERVLTEQAPIEPGPLIGPPDPEWISTLLSLEEDDGTVKLFANDADADDLARVGPPLVHAIRGARTTPDLDWASRTPTFPSGGVHIVPHRHRVDVWSARPGADRRQRLAAAWPGWTVQVHDDRFEIQAERLGGRIRLPRPSRDELVAQVGAIVARAPRDHSGLIPSTLDSLQGDVQWVNPYALRDDPPAPVDDLAARFDAAVSRWLDRQASR
jgi:hypothetical protein